MPSSVTIDERTFPVGPPITRQVDSFPANVKRIRVTMTRVNWPVGNVFKVSVLWSDGTGIAPTVAGGVVLGKDGHILSATARGREADLIDEALAKP